jgi:predicted CXXCH cytochrome family protein
VVDKSAPLLLDEPKDAASMKGKEFLTINNACFVCHNNYSEEELVIEHAKEKTGCVDCHGQSFAHRDDEDNVTPPDKMYPLKKIDAACQECHDTHDAPARKVLARWQERCPQKTEFATIVCTDCHGHHRLAKRTVRWDKETGALISATKEKKVPAGP